mmetsp:Transcript_4216/g.7698  ORF Transcript_4216/g.7698 Transcript_4216/m.7698 type:complete len:354 (+) Transcript_4216:47-1108(+)
MDRLAWRTAKTQLYRLEAAYVKEAVGRDRIRRNKDALRELRCHQEILADLHAGEFGRAGPERLEAARVAAERWGALRRAAALRGAAPEELCEVPKSVKRYLLARPAATGRDGAAPFSHGSSEAATSTRAPSEAALDPESQSTATDAHSEAAAMLVETATLARRGAGQRLSHEQLDELAVELCEQLDQEYTSLLTSIEEVQNLMEAEVAGVELLPSLDDLEVFTVAAEAVLRRVAEPKGKASQSFSREHDAEVLKGGDQPEKVVACEAKIHTVEVHQSTSQVVVRPRWADLSDSDEPTSTAHERNAATLNVATRPTEPMRNSGGITVPAVDPDTMHTADPGSSRASSSSAWGGA